ncbi:hypothetical protein [Haliscomenobacter hydrossis]|uniref:Uncharacterized protein n=1 Tax=Haliscomenobacter hydrossis (strain ATCC 27775 / DSM 1100 / LMG 10767 / O) TaxID=760192 RepID=F4L0H7_HALH1|nr:hypothetical protein [Haliscomenobacter hydrossis]AEE48489.1 hypothetical protein Halhy_0580 [Haliscomenobacter hydrossis DSM 1100]
MSPGDNLHIKYPVLFSVKVLQHYFLDFMDILFDDLPADKQVRILAKYDVRKIWEIQPTPQTEHWLKGRSLVFKKNALGFVVLAGNNGLVGDANHLMENESLRFVIKVIDPYFFQYSAGFLTMEKVKIEKSLKPDVPDRYFKNVYKLGNATASQYPFLAQTPNLYNSGLEYAPDTIVKDLAAGDFFIAKQLVASGSAPQNVTNLNWLKLAPLAPGTPMHYVSSADLVEGLELGEDIPTDAFALIEIKGGHALGAFSLYDAGGTMRSPEFEIRVKNRHTWWRHSLPPQTTGPLTSIVQQDAFPLTAQGKRALNLTFKVDNGSPGTTKNVEKKDVENPNGVTPLLYEKQAGKVQRLLSDMYIQ